jgi:hypothetical protein
MRPEPVTAESRRSRSTLPEKRLGQSGEIVVQGLEKGTA